MGIEEQLLEIKESKSFMAFDRVIPGIELGWFQSVSLLMWLYHKRGGFIFDPGMGKTITISAGLRCLVEQNRQRKTIFFIKKSQITQTANDVRKYAGLRVITCTGEQDQIQSKMYFQNTDNYDVLMVTHEALDSTLVMYYLYQNIHRFSVVVVDEAHYLLNYKESDRALMLASILPQFEYRALLTATPLVSMIDQMAWFMYMIDSKLFENVRKLSRELTKGLRIDLEYPQLIHNYSRKDTGSENTYNVVPVFIEPHDFQVGASGMNVLQKTRGEGSFNQLNEMIRTLRVERQAGKKGIVFIWNHDVREWVLPYLAEAGITYGCIHGKTPQEERDRVQAAFANNQLDVVVISVTTAINLDADYVYLYQFTIELKQIIGRGERGLNPKVMDIFFMFTKQTGDAEYFLNTVYKQSYFVRSIIGKEYTEFLQIGDLLLDSDYQSDFTSTANILRS